MSAAILESHLHDELKTAIGRGLASGDLMTASQIEQQITVFRERFGPAVLRDLDGEALLRLMHGRQSGESRSLAYWLEFKNDDEFAGNRFGSIAGGSALKFGLYQRQSDGEWVAGWPQAQQVLSLEAAIVLARKQRDELLAGAEALSSLDTSEISDESYPWQHSLGHGEDMMPISPRWLDAASIGNMLKDFIEVEALTGCRLAIEFDDGVCGVVDVAMIASFEGVFAPLRWSSVGCSSIAN